MRVGDLTSTLETLQDAKDTLAWAMKSTVKTVNGKQIQASNYPLVAQKTRDLCDALEAHLAVDPQYEWGAGKLLVSCFGDAAAIGSGHPYFPVVEWTWHENDAEEMLAWLRERVAWLES